MFCFANMVRRVDLLPIQLRKNLEHDVQGILFYHRRTYSNIDIDNTNALHGMRSKKAIRAFFWWTYCFSVGGWGRSFSNSIWMIDLRAISIQCFKVPSFRFNYISSNISLVVTQQSFIQKKKFNSVWKLILFYIFCSEQFCATIY